MAVEVISSCSTSDGPAIPEGARSRLDDRPACDNTVGPVAEPLEPLESFLSLSLTLGPPHYLESTDAMMHGWCACLQAPSATVVVAKAE